jgi:hypothetical protein
MLLCLTGPGLLPVPSVRQGLKQKPVQVQQHLKPGAWTLRQKVLLRQVQAWPAPGWFGVVLPGQRLPGLPPPRKECCQ